MKRQIYIVLTALFLVVSLAHAASQLSKGDAAVIKAAGVIIYPGSVYLSGSPDFAAHFATSDSPEKVQEWYRKKLPDWTLNKEMGEWYLHKGKPFANPLELLNEMVNRPRILVGVDEGIPFVWGLKETMKTEIFITIPAQ